MFCGGFGMSKFVINGGKRLSGEIKVQGAKNSVLPVLAATVLCDGECIIHNCPNLSDVEASLKILTCLGCRCTRDGSTVTVDASEISDSKIPDNLMREMRSSVVFLGAILGRTKCAEISSPGGCELGPRPIDIHLAALRRLGTVISEDHGYLMCNSGNGLSGCGIELSFPSVGATENAILAAVLAKGTTVINNAAREPEISDLAAFLNGAGAQVFGAGSGTIVIHGVERLHGTEHSIIPDRIVAATYMSAAAVTGGEIIMHGVVPAHLISVSSVFREAGCELSVNGSDIKICSPERLHRVPTVRTTVYPGFPTDAGPLIIAMLVLADGTSVFVENIFENRFKYIDELRRFGANIKTEGRVAVIEGVKHLSAADCKCTDLRGGAALAVAALEAGGTAVIDNVCHIKRGYDDFVGNLSALGADIREEK